MAIKVGNSWVSEWAYEQVKAKIENEQSTNSGSKVSNDDYLRTLQNEYKDTKFTTNTRPFNGTGMNNIAIAPNILRQMADDPEKRLEYESLIVGCQQVSKALERKGRHVSQGFILDANGNLSSWSISKPSNTGSKTKAHNVLPRDDRDSWQSIILDSLPKTDSAAAKKDIVEIGKDRHIEKFGKGAAYTRFSTATREQITADAAVKVDISEEGRKSSLELKEYGANSPLKYDETFFSKEAREQRKIELSKSLSQTVEIDPFDNEFQILGVTYTFNEGTLEKFISDGLEGKVKNASLVASELGQMIRGTIYNPDATIEERAVNRETALKHAEYIAQNYFDNPDEAKSFLEAINRFAENDILREKGYVVIDNANISPFKSYTMPIDGSISWSEYAKKYGKSDVREIFENPKELESFVKALSSNSQKWSDEIIKSFDDNEKKVSDIIGKIKESLNESDVANSLQRLMKAF